MNTTLCVEAYGTEEDRAVRTPAIALSSVHETKEATILWPWTSKTANKCRLLCVALLAPRSAPIAALYVGGGNHSKSTDGRDHTRMKDCMLQMNPQTF